MGSDRPNRDRHIVLERDAQGNYVWKCSECGWSTSFPDADTPVTPMRAIKEFEKKTPMDALDNFRLHRCADYHLRQAAA